MSNPKDEIARLLETAEEAAYKRGWDEACAAMVRAAGTMMNTNQSTIVAAAAETGLPEPRRTGRPASNIIEIVEDCINQSPGKKGVDVVRAAKLIDSSINERTVRTCLRRLRASKKIWQRNGLWYPKTPRERLQIEISDEEASNPPSHH